MEAKEKAIDLVLTFSILNEGQNELVKQCALLACDEIDLIFQKLTPKDNPYCYLFELEYWQSVKTEIEKL